MCRAIVCRSFLVFKISWLRLSSFVVQLTNALLCIIDIRMNINRLAAVICILDAFLLTFKIVNNSNWSYGVTKQSMVWKRKGSKTYINANWKDWIESKRSVLIYRSLLTNSSFKTTSTCVCRHKKESYENIESGNDQLSLTRVSHLDAVVKISSQ